MLTLLPKYSGFTQLTITLFFVVVVVIVVVVVWLVGFGLNLCVYTFVWRCFVCLCCCFVPYRDTSVQTDDEVSIFSCQTAVVPSSQTSINAAEEAEGQ